MWKEIEETGYMISNRGFVRKKGSFKYLKSRKKSGTRTVVDLSIHGKTRTINIQKMVLEMFGVHLKPEKKITKVVKKLDKVNVHGSKSVKVFFSNGKIKIYSSIASAARATHISAATIWYYCNYYTHSRCPSSGCFYQYI